MSCESECVEISMMVEISVEDFLGIISTLVGLLDRAIIIFISDREFSESAVVLGKKNLSKGSMFEQVKKLNIEFFERFDIKCGLKDV